MPVVIDAEECERLPIRNHTIHNGVLAKVLFPDLVYRTYD